MARIERFEDVEAWREARVLVRLVYEVSRAGDFARDFGLRDQAQRAAVSIMSNIAEGFERGSGKDFVRFLYISKGSAGELRSLLYVAEDLSYIQPQLAHDMRTNVIRISRLIGGLIRYLQSIQP